MKATVDEKKKNKSSQQKKKPKLNPRRFAIAIVIVAFALYFVYVMIWQQVMLSRKNKEIEALEEEIATATQKAEDLNKELENLDDPEYLEKIAREKLGLVRPNERVFIDANQSETNQSDH